MSAPAPFDLVNGGENQPGQVRGLCPGESAPVHRCRHCGVPLTTAAMRASGFCCAGCAYVYRLVHEHGLEGYYKIKDAVLPPVDSSVFQPRDYAWLRELQALAEKAPGTPELTLEVQGISCAGCVWLIEKIYLQQPGALAIETDAPLGRVRIRWDRRHFDAPGFARTLQSFNYLLGPPGEEPAVPESRRLVRRIGLCTAFAMNVMLFTLPVYFGMGTDFAYAHLFSTLALVFATLSLLTGGSFFLGRAVRALRDGVMHIDLPIAVGIVGAYGGSLYGWLSGRGGFVYFDFVASFILLMLVGRWAQVAAVERNRRRLLSASARPQKVGVVEGDSMADRPVELLQAGDVFVVRSGQIVPVESQLESAAATVGTAWITGESDPRACRAGTRVPGGAINLGRGEIRLRAVQGWNGSLLAQLLRPGEREGHRHRFLERIIAGYLYAIFAIALATGIAWWLRSHDAAATWSAVTAVLVVSCPCAIGLAFPLADEMATVALRRFGVFVRESDLWGRVADIRKVIFDKTGTLTFETPVLANPGAIAALPAEARAALFTLVRDNPHPVGQSLYENLLANRLAGDGLPGTLREEPGFGIALVADSGLWSLGRPGWRGGSVPAFLSDDHDTEFAHDGVVLVRLSFTDAIRADAREEIAALRARRLGVYILSGDRRDKVEKMTTALGLSPEFGLGEVTPDGKSAWVRQLDRRDTLMLGDGANDSLAFDAALVRGTPVIHRGVLAGKADFYYLGHGLEGIRRLFEVNATRRRTQAWLLVFSVAYNCLAVGLAAAGRMNPLLAAVLMPASSLVTLAIVIAGLRGWLRR
ncbi:MAG TPA: heavy metal translocating P-type ATPase metal-binding domain-containing protein [Lacunisphaera sp.]|nr:heavy metal translocating P-type ATPase metal-binding domain-containing protein [Lacunisphaera sp.]